MAIAGQLHHPIFDRVSRALAIAGGALLLAMAGLVTVSVVRRWLTTLSVPGDFELVQVGLALAVFSFLPLCQLRGVNIVIDSFTTRAPRRLRAGLDALWSLLYALVAALLAWRMAVGALETISSGTVSMVLAVPIGWAIALATLACGWLALICLVTARDAWGRP